MQGRHSFLLSNIYDSARLAQIVVTIIIEESLSLRQLEISNA